MCGVSKEPFMKSFILSETSVSTQPLQNMFLRKFVSGLTRFLFNTSSP